MGEETVAELRVPDVDDAVKRVSALDVAGDDGERADLAPADEEAAGNTGTIDDVKGGDVKARAVALIDDDRLLQAARLLRAHDVHVPIIDPRDAADVKLNAFIPKAAVMGDLIESLKADPRRPGTEWIVQCEHSGRRDVSIYYRMDEETQTKLTARIESPIRKDMLVPFLSVLNESELYKSWLPNWTMPRLRVRRSDKLSQTGRCSQVVLVTVDLPWPFSSRECVLDAWGVDDIDASGDICVLVDSMTPGQTMRCGTIVPDVDEKSIVRIDFTGGFLFRKLPDGWDAKRDATRAASSWFGTASGGAGSDVPESTGPESRRASFDSAHSDDDTAGGFDGTQLCTDDRILVSVQMYMDPKLAYVPTSLLNFVIRTVMYTMWCMLLRVAEKVRDGKSEPHRASIAAKAGELYDWVRERTGAMLARIFAPQPVA